MAEVKGKIIKKSVTGKAESEYSVADAGTSLIEGQVYDASQVAKDLVQKAEQQAEQILSKAMEERERIQGEARDQGYQEGLAQSTEWIVKAKDHYQRVAENSKNDLKILAVKIAEKIVGKALEMDPELINDIVSQAIRTLRQQKNVNIRCHEDDLGILKKNEKEFLELLGKSGVITFTVDSKIQRGGCMIESEIGVVDARLETQLKTLQKILLTK
ncbi:MAG TPA: type III secretion system stator protein SctL [Acidobacteriota bacterium]|nr:type III secretion system stator protein SctL [Acidobacteriota bacterium]